MLSLLRTIRRSLLNAGATRRYIIYAMGEFILIVAGILVALQINNWNENRKLEQQGLEYIEEIYNDLNTNISNIDSNIGLFENQRRNTEYILETLIVNKKKIQDSTEFIQTLYKIPIPIIVKRDLLTWDELRSSGKSSILYNEILKDKLFEFYSSYDSSIATFNDAGKRNRTEFREITMKLIPYDQYKSNRNSGVYNIKAMTLEIMKNYNSIEGPLKYILLSCDIMIDTLNELKIEAISIKKTIEEQYSSLNLQTQ